MRWFWAVGVVLLMLVIVGLGSWGLGMLLRTFSGVPRQDVAYFDGTTYTYSACQGVIAKVVHPLSHDLGYVIVREPETGLFDRVIVTLGDSLAVGDTVSVTRYFSTGDRYAIAERK